MYQQLKKQLYTLTLTRLKEVRDCVPTVCRETCRTLDGTCLLINFVAVFFMSDSNEYVGLAKVR